jgi:hypothetical protein
MARSTDKTAIVMRSLHLFEEDDRHIRGLAANLGYSKGDLYRGIINQALEGLEQFSPEDQVRILISWYNRGVLSQPNQGLTHFWID